VAIVASAKKCHTNEKSIFRTEGAVVVKKRGGGLLLHLLQAHLHSQNKGGKTLTAKVFIYSFPPENPQQVKLLLWCVARKTSKLH